MRTHTQVLSMWRSLKIVMSSWCTHRAVLPRNYGCRHWCPHQQCYHAIMTNSEFSTFGPNHQLAVRLYDLIVTFSCSHILHTFAPRKHVI